jgi:tRNA pseudouridine13 synthase
MTITAAELAELQSFADTRSLPRACGQTLGSAVIRRAPEDFRVSEFTGIELTGAGEHLYLRIRKSGQNTRWVAKQLAEFLQLPYKAVSYAGMKDRHAVTEQWFSAHMPGLTEPEISPDCLEGCEILEVARHDRKLRPGQLSYNRFQITLRDCVINDLALLTQRIERIAADGVPNYFGSQRFGHQLANLSLAADMPGLRGLNRERRAFFLSSVRGALFNGYLATRVRANSWDRFLEGEVQLTDRPRGTAEADTSVFTACRQPSGLLWGKGVNNSAAEARDTEQSFFDAFPGVTALLNSAGSRASRRVLRLRVAELTMRQHDSALELVFALGPGAYATTVLREIFDLSEATQSSAGR